MRYESWKPPQNTRVQRRPISLGTNSCWYQTSADKDTGSPDSSVSSLSGRTDRQQTAFFRKFRTESRQTKCGQKDIGQSSTGCQNRDRQTPDMIFRKIRTKTRQRQDTDSTVLQRLAGTMVQLLSSTFRKYQHLQIRHNF